jgi:hypothetical protein
MKNQKSAELIARLRNCGMKGSLEMQAADYIEELEKRSIATTAAKPLDLDSLCSNLDKLSANIMNLPSNYKGDRNFEIAYKTGHRDARHAAAELVNEQAALIAQARAAKPADAVQPKREMPSEMKAAIEEAHKTGATGALLPDGSAVFINYGHDYGDNDHLCCTSCRGSGHIEDQQARASLAPVSAQQDTPASIISESVLHAMYKAFQRGDSVERAHAAVMALLPVSAQQGAAEQNNAVECDSALRAEPASQQHADELARAWMMSHGYGNQSFVYALADLQSRIDAKDREAMVLAKRWFGAEAELSAAPRFRAEGGDTSDNNISQGAAKAPAAQADAKEGAK